jgi:hypothetical protein
MPTLRVSYYGSVADGVAANPLSTEVITTSGISAKTANGAPLAARIAIISGDANHWVTIGHQSSVDATGGPAVCVFVPANTERPIRLLARGRGVAAITA